MENNQTTAATQPTPIESRPATPPLSPVITDMAPEKKSFFSSKMLWVIGVVLVLIIVALGAFLYAQNQERVKKEALKQEEITKTLDELESDATSIDIAEIKGDFTEVDKDLNEL